MRLFSELTRGEKQKERLVFTYSLMATALGFFIGLYVNSFIEKQQQRQAFESLKKMILIEAEVNERIANDLVQHAQQKGLFYAELSFTVAEDKLKDLDFIGFADEELTLAIQQYLHNGMVLNNCKTKLGLLRFSMAEELNGRADLINYEIALMKGMEQARNNLIVHVAMIRKHMQKEKG
jgi:hypothetical protein